MAKVGFAEPTADEGAALTSPVNMTLTDANTENNFLFFPFEALYEFLDPK
jgi:hypothetical protein